LGKELTIILVFRLLPFWLTGAGDHDGEKPDCKSGDNITII